MVLGQKNKCACDPSDFEKWENPVSKMGGELIRHSLIFIQNKLIFKKRIKINEIFYQRVDFNKKSGCSYQLKCIHSIKRATSSKLFAIYNGLYLRKSFSVEIPVIFAMNFTPSL